MPAFLPLLAVAARAALPAVGKAASAGALAGVAGRAQNMVQGQQDGQAKASKEQPKNENMQGYFPGRGGY